MALRRAALAECGKGLMKRSEASAKKMTHKRRLQDQGEKFAKYEAGGVREHWITDPERKEADFYVRDERGLLCLIDPYPSGTYRSLVLPGF